MTFDINAFWELNAEAKAGKSFGRIVPWTYNWVCTHIIDLWTQVKENDKWEEYESRSVFINFSFQAKQIKENDDGTTEEIEKQEVSIWQKYTLSFTTWSNLYKDVSGWLGSIPDEQAKKFNVLSLIGKPVQISISEWKSKKTSKKYHKIGSLWALMEWLEPYEPETKLDASMMTKEHLNEDLFKYLPPYAKEDAENSKEYIEIKGIKTLDQDEKDIEAEIEANTTVSANDVEDIFDWEESK